MGPSSHSSSFVPDHGARIWMLNKARKEYWRVASWYELDDLIQDGYMCYMAVRRRYPTAVEPNHIMTLFKNAFSWHIIDLANKRTRQADISERDMSAMLESPKTIEVTCELADLLHAISEAPEVVKAALRALISDPKAFAPFEVKPNKTRETTNQRLAKLIGLDAKLLNHIDLQGLVYKYLKGSTS